MPATIRGPPWDTLSTAYGPQCVSIARRKGWRRNIARPHNETRHRIQTDHPGRSGLSQLPQLLTKISQTSHPSSSITNRIGSDPSRAETVSQLVGRPRTSPQSVASRADTSITLRLAA